MLTAAETSGARSADRGASGIAASIHTLGQAGFGVAFREYLLSVCGADFFALYHFAGDQLLDIAAGGTRSNGVACKQSRLYATGGFWRHDPGLQTLWTREADGRPILAHMYIDHIDHEEMRERLYRPYLVRERIVISARVPGSAVAISLIRTQGKGSFSADDLAALNAASEGIVALALKHISLTRFAGEARSALTSLPTIQACLAGATPALARREAEVCARVLYGMTSMGIALALGISEESAMTYRKRAYSRLAIGSQRELLLWYLDQWSRYRVDSSVENNWCAA